MNTTATNDVVFAPVTNWISKADAQAKRKELIASGLDKKQVKLSSYRWADIKDHSKGYICRVLVLKGLRPELELADTKSRERVKKNNIATFATEQNSGNSATEAMNMTYFCRRNAVDETMTA